MCRVTLLSWHRAVKELKFLAATVYPSADDPGTRQGFVAWEGACDGVPIRLIWEWREVIPSIVALSNPLGVMCNAIIVDEGGHELDTDRQILHWNGAISILPWQSACKQRLESLTLAA